MSRGKDSVRDLRYGRRGGRWKAEPVAGAPKSADGIDVATCSVCNLSFRFTLPKAQTDPPQPPPPHCGVLFCRAVSDWSPLEWALRARAALGRQLVDVPLNDVDEFALANHHPALPWWPTTGGT